MGAMPPARDILKPPPLRRGDTVGIVAPASAIQPEALEAGTNRLRDLGYQVVLGESVLQRDLYFAGNTAARAADFMRMFERSDIRGIICARGGYGANYLLPHVELDVIERNPKILIGYSDITSLLTWITDETGLVTFHGPMAAKDFAHNEGVDLDSFIAAVEGKPYSLDSTAIASFKTLIPGDASGTLYGGCLSMLAASLGTPYEIETSGSILFIEDVATKPYQIDRMLMHMKYAGKFEGVKAIVFGEMTDCHQPGGQQYTLEEIILRVLGDLHIPIAYGLPSGHVLGQNLTLPFGVLAHLHAAADSVTLKIAEAAVSEPQARANVTRQA
jgi:muramoyltetrapeptide carboxypeptidase